VLLHFDPQPRELLSGGGLVSDFQKNLPFVEEVESAMLEVLRGPKYVGKNVYSPYFHALGRLFCAGCGFDPSSRH
jgi:hypothetical protein